MPTLYLSPSSDDFEFITGGTEEYYMNKIADAMVPYLIGSGIEVTRSAPNADLSEIIEESNAGNYDLHFSLGSSVSPEYLSGTLQGPTFFFFADDPQGQIAAEIIADNLRAIYPRPNLVTTVPNRTNEELRLTNATSIRANVGYRDNLLDALWIQDNLNAIGRILALGVSQYFGIPFERPRP
ncbi:N-acetylmuramoyl-L-alanine amidase [Sinanaerobacter chloroacetimidivorans]|uniref:N-acetylmuramoyl-L-alanine amidase n=1 Tax=Sinanaerobacter chloroacetimidivorans TaxID=2818044 RepID=A0A8J7W0Y7_9FIRM|nr:N-acetylmuramoyl-L-alanine amidase [Sinanaerobacter chloroacetimidivorans]MBR0598772.1 N-acetylmuramoyl-L-alanine amidase [Sinanaerobacter chloroacetimidivorans]